MFLISLINIYYGLITYLWNVFTSVTFADFISRYPLQLYFYYYIHQSLETDVSKSAFQTSV